MMQCFVFLEMSAFETCSGFIDPNSSFLRKTKRQSDHILKSIMYTPNNPHFLYKVGFNGTKLHRRVILIITKPSATINEMTVLELQRGFVTWCESHPY